MTQADASPVVGYSKVFLTGFSGAGKTSVGRALAQRGFAWVDLDDFIESKTGQTVPDIIRVEGEEAFRKLESECFEEVLGSDALFVSLGGGALAQKRNQSLLGVTHVVVYLAASVETIVQRLMADEKEVRATNERRTRPLLFGRADERIGPDEVQERVKNLFCQREGVYESAAVKLVTDGAEVEDVAGVLLGYLKLRRTESVLLVPRGVKESQLTENMIGKRSVWVSSGQGALAKLISARGFSCEIVDGR